MKARTVTHNFLEVGSHFWILCFSWLFGEMESIMWLLSSRRQGMLTQGSAPDPKCKLIISSFLTLLHLLDYLICTRNAMPIALLLQMMGVMG